MTKNEKITTETTTSNGTRGFPKTYMRLRTVLDALEISALRYVLNDKNAAAKEEQAAKYKASTRKVRAKEVIEMAMNFIEKIDGQPGLNGCDPGLQMCDGVCVPYDCPGSLE